MVRSRRSGRRRSRTARRTTPAIRGSPFTRPTASSSRPATRHCRAEQVREHGLLHARLSQRGQHLLDVGKEQPVRAHHQHTLALQGESVRVQQVGGPVQRHHGLAGPRPALHNQDAGNLGADDPVLLALDGGHDVSEATGSGCLERGDQGPRARCRPSSGSVARRSRCHQGPRRRRARPSRSRSAMSRPMAALSPKNSSSIPSSVLPRDAKCRRRSRPSGSRPVPR